MGPEFIFSPVVIGIFLAIIFFSCKLQFSYFTRRFNIIGVVNISIGYIAVMATDVLIAWVSVKGEFSELASTSFIAFIITIPFITYWVLPVTVFLWAGNVSSILKSIAVILAPCILMAFYIFPTFKIEDLMGKGLYKLNPSEFVLLAVMLVSVVFFFVVKLANKNLINQTK